jgi:hypothetical protein
MFRLSIAKLMAVVLFFGFGFAALRNANTFWASAAFTIAIISVSMACVRRDRASWAGFAAAGGASLVIWLTLSQTVGDLNGHPRQLFAWLLGYYHPYINPKATGGADLIAYRQVSHALEVVVLGLVGSVLARVVARGDR